MARKHFDDYYNKVYKQYKELQNALADMSAEVESGMMSPERLNQLKQTISPVKNSFESLSYIKYLLDMPTRKSKQDRYNKQQKKLLSNTAVSYGDNTLDVNKKNIEALRKQ